MDLTELDRHPATMALLAFFEYKHLPEQLQAVSSIFAEAAADLVGAVDDGPELTVALRKLLESKDCAVRAAL